VFCRESGGAFGEREAAQEDMYFRKLVIFNFKTGNHKTLTRVGSASDLSDAI